MPDRIVIDEPLPLRPIYVDGFGDFHVVNGVLRCTGFTIAEADIAGFGVSRTAVVKLIVSLAGADHAQMETQRVLREGPTKGVSIWQGNRPAH